MHFIVDKAALNAAVQVVLKAASSKTTIPVLSAIYLEAQSDHIVLRATDMEVAISHCLSGEVIEPGTAVIPARHFGELVRKLPDTRITLKKIPTSHMLMITYGQSEILMHGYDPDEFPLTPEIRLGTPFTCSSQELAGLVKSVSIAASKDETRPIYTGVLLEYRDGEFLIIATDTHRLALTKSDLLGKKLASSEIHNFSIIVPHRTLLEAVRLFEEQEENISITVDNNQILFENDKTWFYSRLLEGRFPNYQQVIPTNFSAKMRARTGELLDSVERAALISREELKIRSNVIKFHLKGQTLDITSNTPDIGKIKETLDIYYEGHPMDIAFNAKYILDVLRILESEEVVFNFTGENSAAVVQPGSDTDYLYLALPLRIG